MNSQIIIFKIKFSKIQYKKIINNFFITNKNKKYN